MSGKNRRKASGRHSRRERHGEGRSVGRKAENAIAAIGRYKDLFSQARALRRKFTLITGPTNSGKTWRAFQLLKGQARTAYLGPLRLLAMEGVDNYRNHCGVKASMITGEESILEPGSTHFSMTVELASTLGRTDAVVIDEAQMMLDPDRGPSWVSAIVGVPADHVIVVGSPACERSVRTLIEYCGDHLQEVIRTERLCPLKFTPDESHIPGTAYIAFSRRDVMKIRGELIARGRRPAIIYGALGPEVRRRQAALFRSGECDCIVATDAIGMGLNLPISKVILTRDAKFDGIRERRLETDEVRQIIGRAGRHGIYEVGYATGFDKRAQALVAQSISGTDRNEKGAIGIWMTREVVEAVAASTRTRMISTVARAFIRSVSEPIFKISVPQDFNDKAAIVDQFGRTESVYDKYLLSMTPISIERNEELYRSWVMKFHQEVRWEDVSGAATSDSFELMRYEQAYNAAVAYCWLARKFPEHFVSLESCTRNMKWLSEIIHESLTLRGRSRPRP